MKTGTCYFPTYGAAMRYYRPYCAPFDTQYGRTQRTQVVRDVINAKLNGQEIHIGKPVLKPGQTLTIKDNRYHITDTPPAL